MLVKETLRHKHLQIINSVLRPLTAGDKVLLLADQTHLRIQDFNRYNLKAQVLAELQARQSA